MNSLLLIDLIDCLAGAGNRFYTKALRHLELPVGFHHIYHRIMHALSHSTAIVPRTRYHATDITPAPGIKKETRRPVGPLYHNTRARTRSRPSLCQLPTFSTRNKTSNRSASITRLRDQDTWRVCTFELLKQIIRRLYFTGFNARLAFVCPHVIIILIIPHWARDSFASITVRGRQGVRESLIKNVEKPRQGNKYACFYAI